MQEKNKLCKMCKEAKPLSFYHLYKTNTHSTFCMECNSKRMSEWKKENALKKALKDYEYQNNETNFVKSAISAKFKPSNTHKEVLLLAGGQSFRKVYVPEITKEEMYQIYLDHLEKMKTKFPESDGRLCRYCEKPFTFLRGKPEFDEEGNRVKRKRIYFAKNFSIDRFHNDTTYKKGNIVFSCKECNSKKNSSEKKDWLKYLEIDKELEDEKTQ